MTEIDIQHLPHVTGGRSNFNEPGELQWAVQQGKKQARQKQLAWPSNIPRDGA